MSAVNKSSSENANKHDKNNKQQLVIAIAVVAVIVAIIASVFILKNLSVKASTDVESTLQQDLNTSRLKVMDLEKEIAHYTNCKTIDSIQRDPSYKPDYKYKITTDNGTYFICIAHGINKLYRVDTEDGESLLNMMDDYVITD